MGAKAREGESPLLIHRHQLRRAAGDAIAYQDLPWLHGNQAQLLCDLAGGDLHPGQAAGQQMAGAMQPPQFALGPRAFHLRAIHQQDALARRPAPGERRCGQQ